MLEPEYLTIFYQTLATWCNGVIWLACPFLENREISTFPHFKDQDMSICVSVKEMVFDKHQAVMYSVVQSSVCFVSRKTKIGKAPLQRNQEEISFLTIDL
jgi:hypothetical protein